MAPSIDGISDRIRTGRPMVVVTPSAGLCLPVVQDPYDSRTDVTSIVRCGARAGDDEETSVQSITPARLYIATYADSKAGIRWRLVSANGRTVGVSTTAFDSASSARGDLRMVQNLSGLALKLTHPTSGVGWLWTALDATGRTVAEGSRVYGRRETCVIGYQRFTQVLSQVSILDV